MIWVLQKKLALRHEMNKNMPLDFRTRYGYLQAGAKSNGDARQWPRAFGICSQFCYLLYHRYIVRVFCSV